MKKANKRKRIDAIIMLLTIVLFAALVVLTTTLLLSFNRNTEGGDIPFDLDRITADSTRKESEGFKDILVPEFIGLTVNGQRQGISVSARAVTDLYQTLAPVISNAVRHGNARSGTEVEWREFAALKDSVYVKYHTELPDIVVGIFADICAEDEKERYAVSSYVYEMFVSPGKGDDSRDKVAVRSANGKVTVYSPQEQTDLISSADISKLSLSYKSQLREFAFAGNRYKASSVTEPVFLDSVTTSNIIISNNIASMMQGNMIGINNIMRVFSINPDKLLSVHEDSAGVSSYTDRSGVFYVYESAFEYKATEGGGIETEKIIGYTNDVGIEEYIYAAYSMVDEIEKIYSYCTGGQADMYLSRVESNGRTVEVEFAYSYDNIRLTDIEPAFSATFRDGSLTFARLYTVAVNSTGYRNDSRNEWWFFEYLNDGGQVPQNVGLVYRSDFLSNSVIAEWSGVIKNDWSRSGR